MEKLFAVVGVIVGFVVVILGVIAYDVFAFSYIADIMWDWFIIPTFPQVPNFTYHEFFAFFLLKGVLLNSHHNKSEDIKDEYKKDNASTTKLIYALLSPWIVLFFAWLIKVFIF